MSILDFNVLDINQEVQISWQTSTDTEVRQFNIEHSIDGQIFEKIDYILSQNSEFGASYSYRGQPILGDVHYYRIGQLNIDGSMDYTSIKSIVFEKESKEFRIIPTIFHSFINIQFGERGNRLKQVFIYNSAGQLVYALETKEGELSLNLGFLDPEVYFVKVHMNHSVIDRKLLKY